jgi:hypothetical protein
MEMLKALFLVRRRHSLRPEGVINTEVLLVFSGNVINSLSYEWLPIKSRIIETLLPPVNELKSTGVFYRLNFIKNLATPYYAY